MSTNYTVPPISLLQRLRKANLVETFQYETEELFVYKVYSILNSLDTRIREMHSVNIFWDIMYDGNKVNSKLPKREVDIQPIISAILSDQMFMSSIEVVPEYTTGVGNLDFMLMASIKKRGVSKICLEVKKAHSKDLIHGLTKQLPLYMENSNVKTGIYLVLWYGKYLDQINTGTYEDLEIELMNCQLTAGFRHAKQVRFFSLDLTKSKSASRK